MVNRLNSRLLYLFELNMSGNCSDSEFRELLDLINLPENEEAVKELIENKMNEVSDDSWSQMNHLSSVKYEQIYREIIAYRPEFDNTPVVEIGTSTHLKWIWIAAALFLIMLGAGIYVRLFPEARKVLVVPIAIQQPNDVNPPSGTHAVITLANGHHIVLDSINPGAMISQGNTRLVKKADGNIVYDGIASDEIEYNTLQVPRGGNVVSMTLSDGTRVWLNSESSLRFPVAFRGSERSVEITGEAYFEVAHNSAMPFKVKKGDLYITVLGTHFNVNAYNNENDIKVSLLEGAIKLNKGSDEELLKPGQQASISAGISIRKNINTDDVIAWKDGKFSFGEASSIVTVMKQLARWYDLEVEYKGVVNGRVGGTISRNIPVSKVLKMLQMTGVFEFELVGKKVIVERK